MSTKHEKPATDVADNNVEAVIEEVLAAEAEAATEQAEAAPELTLEQQLQLELEVAKAQADENWDKLLRAQAEMENIRKRAARDVENARKFALEGMAGELLPVRDSLELGMEAANNESADLQSVRDGMAMIQQMLAKLMDKSGIRLVEPTGEVFNPELHQAMSMLETAEQAPNTVLAVMQKGYTLNDRLLRPAMVVVAKAPAAPAEENQAE